MFVPYVGRRCQIRDPETRQWVEGTITALHGDRVTVTTDAGDRILTVVSQCLPLCIPGTDEPLIPPK